MVPLNNEIFSSRFLPVEKLAIHDTIIKLANDKKCLQHEDVTNEKCSRDARKLCKEVASRRNIPINNKNYNEMLKDVIGNQMTLFDDDTETSHDIGSAATSKSSKRKINKKDKSRHKKHKKHRKEK
ncbi:uncharacterized protein LOC135929369 [Gordionus sp. m RMFG-2023]|uniref:uncharacterized protein LOC135929369 n=1 Tax=Gordionus sp. m RMFG-2023 TaxID=3053472 RepID=UPI0031FC8E80